MFEVTFQNLRRSMIALSIQTTILHDSIVLLRERRNHTSAMQHLNQTYNYIVQSLTTRNCSRIVDSNTLQRGKRPALADCSAAVC